MNKRELLIDRRNYNAFAALDWLARIQEHFDYWGGDCPNDDGFHQEDRCWYVAGYMNHFNKRLEIVQECTRTLEK